MVDEKMIRHIASLKESINTYSSIIKDKNLDLLEKLFIEDRIGKVIGLRNPVRYFKILGTELLDDYELLEYWEGGLVIEGKSFFDNDEEEDADEELEIDNFIDTDISEAEYAEREYYAALMGFFHWALKENGKYLEHTLLTLTSGLLDIGVTNGIWNFEPVIIDIFEKLYEKSNHSVIIKLRDEFSKLDRFLEPIYNMTFFVETELDNHQKTGRNLLLAIAEERVTELVYETIDYTIESYEDILNKRSVNEIDLDNQFTAIGANILGPWNSNDPVMQAAGFRHLCESWILKLHGIDIYDSSSPILFGLYNPTNMFPNDTWAMQIRRLIIPALRTNNALLAKFLELGFYPLTTAILGSITDLWVQKNIEWEKTGVFGKDETVTQYCKEIYSKIATFDPKDLQNIDLDLEESMNALHLLETLRVGLIEHNYDDEAKVLMKSAVQMLGPHYETSKKRYASHPTWMGFDNARMAVDIGGKMSSKKTRDLYRSHQRTETTNKEQLLKKLDSTLESILDSIKKDANIDSGRNLDDELIEDLANKMAIGIQESMMELFESLKISNPNIVDDSEIFWIRNITNPCWGDLSIEMRKCLQSVRIDYRLLGDSSVKRAVILIGCEIEQNLANILYGFKKWWGRRTDFGPKPEGDIRDFRVRKDIETYNDFLNFLKGTPNFKLGFGKIAWMLGKIDWPEMTPEGEENVISEFKKYLKEIEPDAFDAVCKIGHLLIAWDEYRSFRVGRKPFFRTRSIAVHDDGPEDEVLFNENTWTDLMRFLCEILPCFWVLKHIQ